MALSSGCIGRSGGKRDCRCVRGKTTTEVKDKLDKLYEEINATTRLQAPACPKTAKPVRKDRH